MRVIGHFDETHCVDTERRGTVCRPLDAFILAIFEFKKSDKMMVMHAAHRFAGQAVVPVSDAAAHESSSAVVSVHHGLPRESWFSLGPWCVVGSSQAFIYSMFFACKTMEDKPLSSTE